MTNIVYLAVPYSSPLPHVEELRFEAANRAAAILEQHGFVVYSPISMTRPMVKYGIGSSWTAWERHNRAFLEVCSAMVILMLPGVYESQGVAAERRIMVEAGKLVLCWFVSEFEAGCVPKRILQLGGVDGPATVAANSQEPQADRGASDRGNPHCEEPPR